MGITFAGQDLLLEDSDGRVSDWFARWLPLADCRAISEWPQPGGCFSGTSVYYTGQSLPVPNWSKPITPRISSWYRPTGASRWSFGYFLTDYEHLYGGTSNVSASASILGQIGPNNAPQALTISSPSGGKPYQRSWGQCYLLPPHPVSADAFGKSGLWLLPIVDERWYWQFQTGFETPIDNTTPTAQTWAQLFASIASALGITLTVDTVNGAYLYPNPFIISGTSPHDAGHLLDAAAWSVGQRIVPDYGAAGPNTALPGGAWLSQNWTNGLTRRAANLTVAYDIGALQAGSVATFPNQAATSPASVVVAFRAYKNGIVVHDWKTARYAKNVSASAAGFNGGTTSSLSTTVLSTALADISNSGDSTNPDNKATLDSLATQIATDYYASLWTQDSAIVGISQWQESGFDDYVEFNCGERLDDGSYATRTRIHSTPYNEVLDAMLHYDPTTWEYGDKVFGTLDGNLTALGTQTITLTDTDSAKPGGTTHLRVTEVMGSLLVSGTKVMALRYGDKWAAIDATFGTPAVIGYGQCATLLTADQQGNFVLSSGPTVAATVKYGITQAAKNYLICLGDDGNFYVLNPDKILYGQFSTCIAAGSSDTLTIFTGALGAEVTSGVTVICYVRRGACVAARTYIVGETTGGYEVLNPDGMLHGQVASITQAGSSATFTLFGGTQGSESSLTTSVTAYVRRGLCHTGKTYQISQTANGFEVINPTTVIRGQPTGDIATDSTGTLTVYAGAGAGSTTGVTVSSVRNDTSCTVKGSKLAYAEWIEDLGGWAFDIFHSS